MLEVATGELLLVRFSPMNVEKFVEQAELHADHCLMRGEDRIYAISTYGGVKTEDETVEALIARICEEAPVSGKRIWLATAGSLRREGYDSHLSQPPPHHYDVILGNELHRQDAERLVELFKPGRETNPAWKRN